MKYNNYELDNKLNLLFSKLALSIAIVLFGFSAKSQKPGTIDTSKVQEFRINPRAAFSERTTFDYLDILKSLGS